MAVDPGYNRDPLAPKKHYVVVESKTQPGHWEVIGNTGEDIRTLSLAVAKDHACGMQRENMMIVGDDQVVEDSFHNYIPVPQEEGTPIGEENSRIRDRWIKSIVCWLIPRDLADCYDNDLLREDIAKALIGSKVEMSIKPDGRQVVIWRDGVKLSEWSC